MRNSTGEPLAETEDGKGDENETFDKNCGQSNLVRNQTRSMVADNGVGEIGVKLLESACMTLPVWER